MSHVRRILSVASCAFAVLAAPLSADETKLSLDQILQDVEKVNLSVLTSHEFILQSEQAVTQARATVMPTVDFSAGQNRGDSGGPPYNSFSAGLFGRATLIDLRLFDALKAARRSVDASKYQYDDAVQTIRASVAAVYFEHQRNIAFDKVIDSNIERATVLLNLARNQLDAGVATQIDVTRAEAQLVTAQQTKLQQQSVIVESGLRFQRLLNMELGSPFTLEPFDLKRDLPEAIKQLPLDEVLAHRADYQAALANIDLSRLQQRAAGRERLPTLDATAGVGSASATPFDGSERRTWSLGVAVNMPIWDSNRISANVRVAASRVRQGEMGLADLRNSINADFRNAIQGVESQLAQIEVADKNLSLSNEELRLARVRYEQGVADNRELIDAENSYTSASFNLVQAIYNYNVARVQLERARGDVMKVVDERMAPTATP